MNLLVGASSPVQFGDATVQRRLRQLFRAEAHRLNVAAAAEALGSGMASDFREPT